MAIFTLPEGSPLPNICPVDSEAGQLQWLFVFPFTPRKWAPATISISSRGTENPVLKRHVSVLVTGVGLAGPDAKLTSFFFALF